MNRRQFWVGSSSMALGAVGTVAPDQSPAGLVVSDGRTADLRHLAEACGVMFGTAIGPLVETDPRYRAAVLADCNVVVPEYEMKWRPLAPTPSHYDFAAVDRRIAFAEASGMAFRGHTLIWHETMPGWFDAVADRTNAGRIMTDHIRTVVGRYAGRVHSWDVVNEALADEGEHPLGLRRTPLLDLVGPHYIEAAFEAAAEADPEALLVYNDYGLASSWGEAKRGAVLRLLERLRSRDVPVYALGLQCHLDAVGDGFHGKKLARFLHEVAGMGLKLMVTELDVADQHAPADITLRDAAVATVYRSFLDVVLDEPATIAILTWGLSDFHTWLSVLRPRPDGLPVRPLPYDRYLHRKPAWWAIAAAMQGRAAPARGRRSNRPGPRGA